MKSILPIIILVCLTILSPVAHAAPPAPGVHGPQPQPDARFYVDLTIGSGADAATLARLLPQWDEALEAGGAACCILNAANEAAVNGYLHHAIRFGQIARVVEETLSAMGPCPANTLSQVLEADRKAREVSASIMEQFSREGK